MLGWHSAVHGEGNVAFSSSSSSSNGMALPLARRHELATPFPSVAANPSTVSGSSSSSSCTETWPSNVQWLRSPLSAFRKRPGCSVDAHPHSIRSLHEDCASSPDRCARGEDQPLDLTVPKLKVRQHWSGGCIVQVNDRTEAAATATSPTATADGTCNYCCASSICPSGASSEADSHLIVTLQTNAAAFRPLVSEACCVHKPCSRADSTNRQLAPSTSWSLAPRYEQESASEAAFWADNLAPETRRQVSHQQRSTQLFWDAAAGSSVLQRLQVQVRIPHHPPNTSADQLTTAVPEKIVQFLRTNRPRKPAAALSPASAAGVPASAIPQPLRPQEATPAPVDSHVAMDDDLRRLTQCLHHLQSSGYYYGNLSWKESIQLLQGTPVGTFLVRDSSDPRYLYALSIQTDRGPTSVRIHYTDGCFRLDADALLAERLPKFRSVPDLVDFYVSQWKRCREHGQVWLDNSGQVHSDVVLHKALLKECPSLQHLCRLSWNQLPSETKLQWSLSGSIPQRVQSYLREYPYQY